MTEALRPKRGGFLRPFGCGWFVREFLSGHAPYGSQIIDPVVGAPQSDIFHQYKNALRRATALDRATRDEEKAARREDRPIDPDNIEILTDKHMARLPYKATGCRYHSFVVYVSTLTKLGWVEPSNFEEPSAFQDHYPPGPPRRFYRLTQGGRDASRKAWANPHQALYSRTRS